MTETLLIGAGIALITTALYGFVGRAVVRRPVSDQNRLANTGLATWWFALAGTTGLGAIVNVLTRFAEPGLSFYVTFTFVSLVLVVFALWGLLYYLLFLFTGKRWIITPLSVFYVGYAILLLYFVQSGSPNGVESTGWNTTLQYATPQGAALTAVVVALLILPQLLGALALLSLVFVARDREQRFRLAVVSLSIIVWFGSSYAGALAGFGANLSWQLVTRFIGLGAAIAILVAYQPPQRVRAWLAAGKAPEDKPASIGGASGRLASTDSRPVPQSTLIGTVS